MSWLGIGLVSTRSSRPSNLDGLLQALPFLSPAEAWTGTAASGFATIPTDPARTTAKPALRLIVPPFQHFTDTLAVGVIAAANDGGSLANNFGIASIAFHYEGNVVQVVEPSWATIPTERGPRTYFGWWVRLRKPPSKSGNAQLYVEATARNATFQKRVIGPFLFSPVNQKYDLAVAVSPSLPEVAGQRYQTILAAANHARSVGAHNPLVTIVEGGLYEIPPSAPAPDRFDRTGYLNITAAVPGVRIGKATPYTTDAAAILGNMRFKLHLFGPNLSIDYNEVTYINGSGQSHWIDGITLTSSHPDGKDKMWRGMPTPNNNQLVGGTPYFTECDFIDVTTPCVNSALVRGCFGDDLSQDLVSDARCVVHNTFQNHENIFWNTDIPAFTVQYTGPEATATISRSQSTQRIYTVTIGATSYTFDVGQSSEDYANYAPNGGYKGTSGVGGYWFADVVQWLNTLPGISASLLISPDRYAGTSCLAGQKGLPFTNLDIKTAPRSFVSLTDKHGDFYQHQAGEIENVVVAFNRVTNVEAQLIFLGPYPTPLAGQRDMFFFCNAMSVAPPSQYHDPAVVLSQWGARPDAVASHVCILHNTFANQGWRIEAVPGFLFDQHCMIKNNVMRGFSLNLGKPANLVIDGVHMHAGQPGGQGITNSHTGGNETNLFANFQTGDFAPAGDLLLRGFRPAVPFDLTGKSFPEFAAYGAVAAEAPEYIPPPPSDDPVRDLLVEFNIAGATNAFHRYDTAALVGSTMTSSDLTANNNPHTQATANNRPVRVATGLSFDGNDTMRQTIAGGIFTVIMAFAKSDASTHGNLIVDQGGAGVGAQYQSGNTAAFPVTVRVGEDIVTNPNALYLALHQAGERIITIEGANFTGDTLIQIGRTVTGLAGVVRRVAIARESDFAGRLTEIRQLMRDAVAAT